MQIKRNRRVNFDKNVTCISVAFWHSSDNNTIFFTLQTKQTIVYKPERYSLYRVVALFRLQSRQNCWCFVSLAVSLNQCYECTVNFLLSTEIESFLEKMRKKFKMRELQKTAIRRSQFSGASNYKLPKINVSRVFFSVLASFTRTPHCSFGTATRLMVRMRYTSFMKDCRLPNILSKRSMLSR